jgi:hypothetical protein
MRETQDGIQRVLSGVLDDVELSPQGAASAASSITWCAPPTW